MTAVARLAAAVDGLPPTAGVVVLAGDVRDLLDLWEIAENLHRCELTEAERRQHIAEWVRLTAEKVAHRGPPSGGAQPLEQGIRKAAAELNMPRATVQRAVRAESLPPEAKAIADEAGLGTVARAKAAAP